METTNQALTVDRGYVSFGQRLATWLVDWSLCLAVLVAAEGLARWLDGVRSHAGGNLAGAFRTHRIARYALKFVGAPASFAGGWRRGQTLGMKLAGIRLADRRTGGRRPSLRLAARFAVSFIPILAVFLALVDRFWKTAYGLVSGDIAILFALEAFIALIDAIGQRWVPRDPWGQIWADEAARVVVVRIGHQVWRQPEWIAR